MLGKLLDTRHAALDAQYAKEQGELAGEIAELEKAIRDYEQTRKSAKKFIALPFIVACYCLKSSIPIC